LVGVRRNLLLRLDRSRDLVNEHEPSALVVSHSVHQRHFLHIMNIEITLTEADLKVLVRNELERRMGEITLEPSDVKIETKSTQNYKSEWETAAFRARVIIAR